VITGEVGFNGDIVFPLIVRDARGGEHTIPAILDTGFQGRLTLPPEIIEALALEPNGEGQVTLGDDTEQRFPLYSVTLLWFGEELTIDALLVAGMPLVGQRLMRGCFVTHHSVDSGAVMLYRPPQGSR
jgi:predicted aspartyl protease